MRQAVSNMTARLSQSLPYWNSLFECLPMLEKNFPVTIPDCIHPIPFRTRWLRFSGPMIVPQGVKVGCCRNRTKPSADNVCWRFFRALRAFCQGSRIGAIVNCCGLRLNQATTIDSCSELNRIVVDPQHREQFDDGDLKSLASDMQAQGLIQPIVVR